jgi:hypothetical protein
MQCYDAYYQPQDQGCGACYTTSNSVVYVGPNLPNSGVQTNDCLTLALEKIDNKMSAASILAAIAASPTLSAQFCAIVASCSTTTTTTSSTSTTTTTTTAGPCPNPNECMEGGAGIAGYLCYGVTEEIAHTCGDQQEFRYNKCGTNTFWIGQEVRAYPYPYCNPAPDGWYYDIFASGDNSAHVLDGVVVAVSHYE